VKVEEIVARVWPDERAEIELLGGGITNHNFKVAVPSGVFVLRIGGKDTALLGIDREVEHQATLAAAAVGVGPEVLRFIEPEGYLVTRYIDGRPVPPEEMRRPENIRRAADALRAFHAGRSIPGRFDAFRMVEAYKDGAEAHGVRIPCAWEGAHRQASEIERLLGGRALRPCHNDLLNTNFIDDGERLRIVDWEYAGMGDRLFDLANFSINHELEPEQDDELLAAHGGAVRPRERAAVSLMRFMSDFREAMWGVVQQGISELDFDFVSYAALHFERMARTAASERFRTAVQILGSDSE
jgi:thiamine kinase-like enzyme